MDSNDRFHFVSGFLKVTFNSFKIKSLLLCASSWLVSLLSMCENKVSWDDTGCLILFCDSYLKEELCVEAPFSRNCPYKLPTSGTNVTSYELDHSPQTPWTSTFLISKTSYEYHAVGPLHTKHQLHTKIPQVFSRPWLGTLSRDILCREHALWDRPWSVLTRWRKTRPIATQLS